MRACVRACQCNRRRCDACFLSSHVRVCDRSSMCAGACMLGLSDVAFCVRRNGHRTVLHDIQNTHTPMVDDAIGTSLRLPAEW